MRGLEKIYCVYKHTNICNGKIYVGITSQQPEKRWKNGHGYEGNEYFYRAIQKYGWNDGFEHEIIVDGLTKAQACAIEIELIDAYDSTNPDKGYNFSSGGDCGNAGCDRSEEWVEKMSEALSKPVICIESSITYKSATEAENQTGIRKSAIGESCRHHTRTAGGLHWCFWDEDWSNFKSMCKKLGVIYTRCDKCGVLITKGNTKPRKYCSACSGNKPVGIKKKPKPIKSKPTKKKKDVFGADGKRRMRKINQ